MTRIQYYRYKGWLCLIVQPSPHPLLLTEILDPTHPAQNLLLFQQETVQQVGLVFCIVNIRENVKY